MTRLILMCGLPGAGNTTRARELADRLPAIRFQPPDPDELRQYDPPA